MKKQLMTLKHYKRDAALDYINNIHSYINFSVALENQLKTPLEKIRLSMYAYIHTS